MRRFLFFFQFILGFPFICLSDEPCLKEIKQITFSEMGFEKAGEAYFSPDDKTIAFQAVPSGEKDYQIYLMSLYDKSPKMISTGKGACTCANFHPNGKKMIFASSHLAPDINFDRVSSSGYKWVLTPFMNIYEVDLDGSNLKPLTKGPAYHAECAYSPDGTKIVYAANESGSMNIFMMDSGGSNVKQLTFTDGIYNGGPFFSPDGKKIVYRADKELKDYLQIYLIDLETQEETQLTQNDAVNWAPFWHPDGNKIAFTTSIHGHHRYEIYLLHTDTLSAIRITDYPDFDGLPVFSHDGNKLMWTSKRSRDGSCQLFIADFINPFKS